MNDNLRNFVDNPPCAVGSGTEKMKDSGSLGQDIAALTKLDCSEGDQGKNVPPFRP